MLETQRDRNHLQSKHTEIQEFFNEFSQIKKNYLARCLQSGFDAPSEVLEFLDEVQRSSQRLFDSIHSCVESDQEGAREIAPGSTQESTQESAIVEYQNSIFQKQTLYRTFLALKSFLNSALEWRSPSYSQSVQPVFFHESSQESPTVNYNRYESRHVEALENQLAEILDLDSDTAVLMTSSGMAAYTLFESFALRKILKPNDTILIPHYFYFEIDQQITSLTQFKIVKKEETRTEQIIQLILEHRPRLVFLDAMNNNLELRVVDVDRILSELSKLDFQKLGFQDDLWILIDGTLVSGAIQPFRAVSNPRLKVVYLESCSKYLQQGQDLSMAGLLAFPMELKSEMLLQRRNTGTILFDSAVHSFPQFNRVQHLSRMKQITQNAHCVAQLIQDEPCLREKVKPHFPLLREHPDYDLAQKIGIVGGLVTFEFLDPRMQNRDRLNQLIQKIIEKCQREGLAIVKGVSFGFSIPRISASAAMAESRFPFMRLSMGDVHPEYARKLGQAIVEVMSQIV